MRRRLTAAGLSICPAFYLLNLSPKDEYKYRANSISSKCPSSAHIAAYCEEAAQPNQPPVSSSETTPPKSCTKTLPGSNNSVCSQYNTPWQRMQWAQRRRRCNEESGCVFLGKAFTGVCSQRDSSVIPMQQQRRASTATTQQPLAEESSEPGASLVKLYVEIKNDKSAEPIKILMKESIASSAVDSLRDSHELAHELSKSMILNYLNDPETVNVVLGLTKSYLEDKGTRAYLGDYLASYLMTDQVKSFYKYQLNITRDYYCLPNGLGRSATDQALLDLLVWWVGEPANITAVVVPLLEWTLLLDYIRASSAEIAAYSLPYSIVSNAVAHLCHISQFIVTM